MGHGAKRACEEEIERRDASRHPARRSHEPTDGTDDEHQRRWAVLAERGEPFRRSGRFEARDRNRSVVVRQTPRVLSRCLVQPGPSLLDAADQFRLVAAAALQGDHDLAVSLLGEVDEAGFRAYWTAGGLEWERRHKKDAHVPVVAERVQ